MSGTSTTGEASPKSLFERAFRTYHAAGFLPILLPILLIAFALFVPNFVKVQNLFNVLRSSSYLVIIAAGQMLVLKPGVAVTIRALSRARCMLLGGEPADAPRHIWWNFVSSSRERIEQAKADWTAGRFAGVPGETEFIPLPPD